MSFKFGFSDGGRRAEDAQEAGSVNALSAKSQVPLNIEGDALLIASSGSLRRTGTQVISFSSIGSKAVEQSSTARASQRVLTASPS